MERVGVLLEVQYRNIIIKLVLDYRKSVILSTALSKIAVRFQDIWANIYCKTLDRSITRLMIV